MILVIDICREKFHRREFVNPITLILDEKNIDFFVKQYNDVSPFDLEKASGVIICGTSLFDNEFTKHINLFNWLKHYDKPVLGICAGMHILGLVFNGILKKKTEIGFYFENFKKNFLGVKTDLEVYHLHNYYVDFTKLSSFEIFSGKEISQAVKHKKKPLYGVLFHPEVRNKNLILEFVKHG